MKRNIIIGVVVVVLAVVAVTSANKQNFNPDRLLAQATQGVATEDIIVTDELIQERAEQGTITETEEPGTTEPSTTTEEPTPVEDTTARLAPDVPVDTISAQYASLNVTGMQVGVNPENMFEGFGNNMVTDDVIAAMNELHPAVIRYPGGILAEDGNPELPGYGRGIPVDAQYTDNHKVRFIDMVQSLNYEPEVILVFNMKKHFPNSINNEELFNRNLAFLDELLAAGINVTAVEYGNELYFYDEVTGWITWYYPAVKRNVAKYLNLVGRYVPEVESRGITTHIVPWANSFNQRGFFWNVAIVDIQPNFITHVAPHPYGLISERCNNGQDLACVRQDLDRFLQDKEQEYAWIAANLPYGIAATEFKGIHFQSNAASFPTLANSDLEREYTLRILNILQAYGADIALHNRALGTDGRHAYDLITMDPDTFEITVPPNFVDFKMLNQ